ncbi:hypothetical protein [Paracoccus lutimaris]|uniref:Uncharacterized protein n=1 Tax=Paracoccus lutimaris TaxID=1490030 RepID=A0A368ZA32_9RHOB|nr:hypothetical protein [Paracoccus lutimaris]RCW88648.1 hypothetical protein DFP89_10181 [Paracoccus lutimaris]
MKLPLTSLVLLPLSAGAALACSAVEVTKSTVTRGEGCSVAYSSAKLSIASYPVERLSPHVLRQVVTKGACIGEQIVFYYDCAQGRGVWLGGEFSTMGVFSPEPPKKSASYVPPAMSPGPAAYFAENLEPTFAPGYDIDAIHTKAAALPWITQTGRISTPKVTVEGKPFNLACGCKLKSAP